jgi:hypothetical protein
MPVGLSLQGLVTSRLHASWNCAATWDGIQQHVQNMAMAGHCGGVVGSSTVLLAHMQAVVVVTATAQHSGVDPSVG